MPTEKRVQAAEAFWRDTESPEIATQHAEAMILLARRLNFRAKSIQGMSIERRAKHLAQLGDLSDALATRALIAYHFAGQRPLMAAFLEALGIAHDDGLITVEEVVPPDADGLAAAATKVKATFPSEDVDLYLRTLLALDGQTWSNLAGLVPSAA
ncbi:MAG: hypothetical protein ABI051_12140 [Vicinamibacterales bacterium]